MNKYNNAFNGNSKAQLIKKGLIYGLSLLVLSGGMYGINKNKNNISSNSSQVEFLKQRQNVHKHNLESLIDDIQTNVDNIVEQSSQPQSYLEKYLVDNKNRSNYNFDIFIDDDSQKLLMTYDKNNNLIKIGEKSIKLDEFLNLSLDNYLKSAQNQTPGEKNTYTLFQLMALGLDNKNISHKELDLYLSKLDQIYKKNSDNGFDAYQNLKFQLNNL
ncbi:MAG: hypothetical protein ACOCP8_10025 [archaeon]